MVIKNGCYTVYVLTNNVNKKMYIGVTSGTLGERFNNGKGYYKNKKLYGDILEYGWDKFEGEKFASNLTEEEAFNTEKLLIQKIREQDPDVLYNKDAGGKHGKHCQETKDVIRQANIGRIITEETKVKIRVARAKQVISREAIMKTAEKNRGRKMSPEFCKKLGERSSKSIKCLENNVVYTSATEASKELNVSKSGICLQLKGKIPHIKQLHFEYV